MPAYYKAKVLNINKAEASTTIHLQVISPDSMQIYDSVGFGLHLLDNYKWKGNPIADEITYEELTSTEWCTQYANGFVKKVEIIEHLRPISLKVLYSYKEGHPFFKSKELWPEAIVKVHCTDAAWLAHLNENEEWESYAWDVSRHYNSCDPILAGQEADGDTFLDWSEGWMPIPSFLFDQGKHKLPSVLFFPKFTESSYDVVNITDYSNLDHQSLIKLHGKFVKHVDDNYSGIFVWNDVLQEYKIYSISSTSTGMRSYSQNQRIGKIGLLSQKKSFKRRTKNVDYSGIFRRAKPSIKSVVRDGKLLTIELTGIYDIDNLGLNKTRILKMICNNFVETYEYEVELDTDFPLSQMIKYLSRKEDKGIKQVLVEIADKIIVKYSYEYPDNYVKDYDEMDFESLLDYFGSESWPCFKFYIELSDEAFGLQVDQKENYGMLLQLNYLSDPIEHDGEVILWSDYRDKV